MRTFSLVTDQDTAMPEATLCADHSLDANLLDIIEGNARLAGDWNGKGLVETTDNPEVACFECGEGGA